MNQNQVKVGVAVVAICNGKVLMGKRIGSHGAGCYSVPGGHLEFGETLEMCAQRELLEETGLETDLFSLVSYSTEDFFEDENKHFITMWVGCEVSEELIPENLEPAKCEGWQWYDWNALPSPLFLPVNNFIEKYGKFYLE